MVREHSKLVSPLRSQQQIYYNSWAYTDLGGPRVRMKSEIPLNPPFTKGEIERPPFAKDGLGGCESTGHQFFRINFWGEIPLNPPFPKGEIESPLLSKGGLGGFESTGHRFLHINPWGEIPLNPPFPKGEIEGPPGGLGGFLQKPLWGEESGEVRDIRPASGQKTAQLQIPRRSAPRNDSFKTLRLRNS